MNFLRLDDDSLRKIMSYLSFQDHFNLIFVDQRFENVVYTACKYIYVKLTVRNMENQAEPAEPNLHYSFYKLITGKADDDYARKYQIFDYVEKLHLEYLIEEAIDLAFMSRLKELNLNLTRANSKCKLVDNRVYPNVRTLFVREFSQRYQRIFPNVTELGCDFLHSDILPNDTVKLLCLNAIFLNELAKFTGVQMISLDLDNNLFNISHLPFLLTRMQSLIKLHITFFLRKNTLSIYTRAIQKLVNLKIQNRLNLELCIHLNSFTKDHKNVNTCDYRKSEVSFFKENANQFIRHLVSFQVNGIELTCSNMPDSVALFMIIGAKELNEKDLVPFLSKETNDKDLSSYLKNLKTIRLVMGTDDCFFAKLAKYATKLKTIEIKCPVKQALLDSIPVFYKDISSFSLHDPKGEYDIGFLKNMRYLRTLALQIGVFKNLLDLQSIITKCIFLNYLTLNLDYYEQIKESLISLYEERSLLYPFTTIILTVKYDPIRYPAQASSYSKITKRFSIHILPDLIS